MLFIFTPLKIASKSEENALRSLLRKKNWATVNTLASILAFNILLANPQKQLFSNFSTDELL